MQISLDTLEGLQRKLTVQIPAETVNAAVDKKLQQLSKTVRLDGFRKGKVPLQVVRKMYGGGVRQEVFGDVVESSYQQAIIEKQLRPAGMPEIGVADAAEENGFAYTATFEVYPEVEVKGLELIEVSKPLVEIGDDDLEEMMDKLRKQRMEWEVTERAAESGDEVVADYAGSIDGEAFEGGTGESMKVEIGAGRMLKEFEDGLLGMKAGEEKTISLTFPEDYHGKDVAGKEAQFVLKVTEVRMPKLPEIDAEFVKAFGVENGDIEQMRSEVKGNMQNELDQRIKTKTKNAVMDGLLGQNDVLTPTAMVDQEIDALRRQAAQGLGQNPEQIKIEDYPAELFQAEAEKRVKLGLLISQLIQAENLTLEQERLESTLEKLAQSYDQPEQVIQYYRENPEARSSLEGMVMEDQVVDFILSKAKVSEETQAFKDIMDG